MSGKGSKGIGIVIFLLILAIAATMCSIYYIYTTKTQDDERIANLEAEVENLKSENAKYKKTIDKVSDALNSVNEEKTKEKAESKWNGDVTKVDLSKLNKEGVQYEELSMLSGTNEYAVLATVDGVVRVSVEDKIKDLFEDFEGEDTFELEGISNVEITVFSTFGQDFSKKSPVLFIMKDGTLKYDTFENVIENKISPKTVTEVKDVVQVYGCSIADVIDGERMGGAMTTVAVGKDGVAYDLSDYITLEF